MTLYFSIAFFLFIGMFIGSLRYKTGNENVYQLCQRDPSFLSPDRLFFLFFLSILAFLTAMRSAEIGNDTIVYIDQFLRICKYGVNQDFYFEKGYQFFCLCVSKISTDPHHFLMIVALFCYGMLGFYSLKYSSNLLITICLIFCFCFSPLTNILRQDMAMVICLFAYQALKKNNIKAFFLLVLLAFQFHSTALCMLTLPILRFLPSKFLYVLIIGLLFVLLSCLVNMSGLIASWGVYDSYFEGDRVGSGWLGTSFGMLRAFFMYYIVSRGLEITLKKNYVIYSNFWEIIDFSALGFQMNLFNRCALYFLFIAVVELPNALELVKGEKNFYRIFFFSLVMLLYFFLILFLRPEWNSLTPYRFW